MNKDYLEYKMDMLLMYGRVQFKGLKSFHDFASYCEAQGYKLEELASIDGRTVSARLVTEE